MVEELLSMGVSVKTKDHRWRTALHLAAEKGHTKTLLVLGGHQNADTDARDIYGSTPLHLAARKGHEATVGLLVRDLLADPMPRANSGLMPLHLAARYGHSATVPALVYDLNADPTAQDHMDRTAWDHAIDRETQHVLAGVSKEHPQHTYR